MVALVLQPRQKITGAFPIDKFQKKNRAYIVQDRVENILILCQSLPLLASYINNNLSCGEAWDTVSVTGLFENMNRTDRTRNGGWHKGRFKIAAVPLETAREAFENLRSTQTHNSAVIVGYNQLKSKSASR